MRRAAVLIVGVLMVLVAMSGPKTAFAQSTLTAGQWLYASQNQQLVSNNLGFKFVMQSDGNLVLYYTGKGAVGVVQRALWASGTYHQPVLGVVMQTDGNLVIYSTGTPWTALWASNSCCYPPAQFHLDLQDDGNAVIYPPSGAAIWATGTSAGRNTESWGDSRGAGDCWRPGTPWTCVDTWTGRSTNIYFRAIDQFSSSEPNWLTGASAAVSTWNGAPGPQYYSFTPTSNDSWVYAQWAML